jgi:glyoxylase-like metal-dependent hydrolase (beta-lactamase superfamily II)
VFIQVFSSGPIDTNAMLIACEKSRTAAIIDPALGSAKELIKTAKKKGFSIQVIYLTHSHWDHIGDLKFLKDTLKVPVYVHKQDAHDVEYPPKGAFAPFPITGTVPDGYLEDGQVIQLGDLSFTVIHTPGHSPGGVCFYFPTENVLISGDTLFKGTMGRIDLPHSLPALMWGSLKKLSKLPPETRVFPGHGDDTTIGREKWIEKAQEKFNG